MERTGPHNHNSYKVGTSLAEYAYQTPSITNTRYNNEIYRSYIHICVRSMMCPSLFGSLLWKYAYNGYCYK